jgi:hypothetical protein
MPPIVPTGPPGAMPPDAGGPTEGMLVSRMNELSMAQKQARHDRLEAESRGHDSVFSQ